MTNATEIIVIPIIVTIVYGAMTLYKQVVNNKEVFVRLIPLIAAFLGSILGITAFYLAPEIMPAQNILSAILYGGASGLAATGTHQIIKQIGKSDDGTQNGNDENKT